MWILSSIGRSKESLGGVASSVMEKKESLKGEVGESDEVQSIHGSEGGKVRCGRDFLLALHQW